jgi:hypothetical protein
MMRLQFSAKYSRSTVLLPIICIAFTTMFAGCGANPACSDGKSYVVLEPPPNLPPNSIAVVGIGGQRFTFMIPCSLDQELGNGVHLQCTTRGWILGPNVGMSSATRSSVTVSRIDGTVLLSDDKVPLSAPTEIDPDGDPGYCERQGSINVSPLDGGGGDERRLTARCRSGRRRYIGVESQRRLGGAQTAERQGVRQTNDR